MINICSVLISEQTCCPEHLNGLDHDWMEPAYLSSLLLLSIFCRSRRAAPHERETHTYTQLHKLQSTA